MSTHSILDYWTPAWMPAEYSGMNNNNISTLAIALTLMSTDIGAWNLKITNLNPGRL
jgi:hypothetical protein